MVGDTTRPGIQAIINRLRARGDLEPEQFVDACFDLMGPMVVEGDNREQLVNHARELGTLTWADDVQARDRVGEMLQLVVSLREYQYA